jgi:hypothetical protein
VRRFWPGREDELARELRANRPVLPADFVRPLAQRIAAARPRTGLYAASRLSFAGAITVLALGTLISFGGLGYAASGTRDAVKAVKRVVAPTKPTPVVDSAASAQYRQKKVTVCHNGHEITIAEAALPAHLAHGDTLGPCPATGVAGVRAAVLNSRATSSRLPFTGISLGVTVLVALLLFGTGVALRRSADRKQ